MSTDDETIERYVDDALRADHILSPGAEASVPMRIHAMWQWHVVRAERLFVAGVIGPGRLWRAMCAARVGLRRIVREAERCRDEFFARRVVARKADSP